MGFCRRWPLLLSFVVACLETRCWAFVVSPRVRALGPLCGPLFLFGGGKKEGGGALSNVASVMDQFKKAQEIAKKSNELQQELAATFVEGASADGKVVVKMSGQQTPTSATVEDFASFETGAALSDAYTEAFKAAQAKSLEEMNVGLFLSFLRP